MSPGKHSRQSNSDRKQCSTNYYGDRLLLKRVQEYVDSESKNGYVDVDAMVEDLQHIYKEYGRKKRIVFKKAAEKAYNCIESRQSRSDHNLDEFEARHLSKRRKQEDDAEEDSNSDSFSSDNPDYVQVQDSNLVNSSLSNLYMKRTPTSTPKSRSAASTPLATPLVTPHATPRPSDREDDDRDSMEMGTVTLDLAGFSDLMEDEGKQISRKPKLLMPNVKKKEEPVSDKSSQNSSFYISKTPSKIDSKDVKTPSRKSSTKGEDGTEASTKKKPRSSESEGPSRKGKKKVIEPQRSTSTFADIGGNDSTLEEVCKLLVHMRHPEVYQQLGVSPPRGVLLHGPPGCGKTLLANAIAGELDLPYLKLAATEIVSGVSGESEENIRDLFEQAQALAPSVLFIDEIDAITPKRETAQREMERRIVAQLLACMDELNNGTSHVMVIGATNRVDSLDPALRRAGRFDREISLGIPDEKARTRILHVLCRKLRLSDDFSYHTLAALTPGYVGADLTALCREAAMAAVNRVFTYLQNTGKPISDTTLGTSLHPNGTASASDQPRLQHTAVSSQHVTATLQGQATSATEEMDTGSVNELVSESTRSDSDLKESESYKMVLSWLKEHPPLSESQLEGLYITMEDFKVALPNVQPSAKREGFATIPDVTWDDVGALEGVREELTMAILAPVRNPEAYHALGLTNPPGILLAGPPGCGKTLLAKAIANESGINFISVKGPELMNMYVGESERAVRQCFQRARNSSPCVIFFDELDALCPRRSDVSDSGSSARVVNQLLTEMDGLEARKQVFIMGATNRPDIIDPAVLRPGRMDKILYVGIPSNQDRKAILRTITKNGCKPILEKEVNLNDLAEDSRCNGFTGADLAAFVREASMSALRKVIRNGLLLERGDPAASSQRDSNVVVCRDDFEAAFRKVKPSVSRKDRIFYERMRSSVLRDASACDEDAMPKKPEESNEDPKT
ncbi:nuclear valosin-containing protein-like [Lytechinus pictus]|uniref:nuclear valosin-containing protein-like n=1 Tax=Lytechinus pictus TaxID=7653 RepID=UPI0030BA2080